MIILMMMIIIKILTMMIIIRILMIIHLEDDTVAKQTVRARRQARYSSI